MNEKGIGTTIVTQVGIVVRDEGVHHIAFRVQGTDQLTFGLGEQGINIEQHGL
jgi:hypothetical protein